MAIRRNDPVRVFGKRLLLLALFGVVVIAAWGVFDAFRKERESLALRQQAEIQLKDFSERQHQLNADIANLQTSRGVEGVLRRQFALASEGEGLIVIVDQATPSPKAASSSVLETLKQAFTWW